jgi:hypothetical protein
MKPLKALGALIALGTAFGCLAAPPSDVLVKDIHLQSFFHTRQPWEVKIYQPTGEDADTGKNPVRVCFVGPNQAPDCVPLLGSDPMPEVGPASYPLQTLAHAELKMLPTAPSGPKRPALVVEATFSGGGSGVLRTMFVWTDLGPSQKNDLFTLSFRSTIGNAGQQEFVSSGPLAGYFVMVDQTSMGDEANEEAPKHYVMDVYAPATLGYTQVLTILSKDRYPSNHTGDGLPNALQVLTPEIARALSGAYPNGMPSDMYQSP